MGGSLFGPGGGILKGIVVDKTDKWKLVGGGGESLLWLTQFSVGGLGPWIPPPSPPTGTTVRTIARGGGRAVLGYLIFKPGLKINMRLFMAFSETVEQMEGKIIQCQVFMSDM